MLVFKDIIAGDELISDSFGPELKADGLVYEANGKSITVNNDVDEALIGGNKSAEADGEDESVDPNSTTGIDIVISFKLQETTFDLKSYGAYLKDYMKALAEKITAAKGADAAAAWKSAIQKYVSSVILPGIKAKQFQFFTGESMNPEGMVVLMNYREDGSTPYFIFFKEGLVEEKC
eukprot:m.219889 g.219889  ORF g.219889 m.219889 type:complete len:177 (+) comp10271_c0_seq1:1597-2127(+)